MEIFYTQEFLEYVALSMGAFPCELSKGYISEGATITETLVIGEASKRGKKYKIKSGSRGNILTKKSFFPQGEKLSSPLWDFSTDTDYITTTSFISNDGVASGLLKNVFEIALNSLTDYLAIPFDMTKNDCPGTISEDYGGSTPMVIWSDGGNFWNCTAGNPTLINGSSIDFYFDEKRSLYQCTMPEVMIGYGSSTDGMRESQLVPYNACLVANKNIILDDGNPLILYGVILEEEVEAGKNWSLTEYVLFADIVII